MIFFAREEDVNNQAMDDRIKLIFKQEDLAVVGLHARIDTEMGCEFLEVADQERSGIKAGDKFASDHQHHVLNNFQPRYSLSGYSQVLAPLAA